MRRNVVAVISFIVVLLLCGLGVGLYFLLRPDEIKVQWQAAVATATVECTDVATRILTNGGSAVDSAIGAALCQGLTVPQSSGLGGGLIATVYIKATGTIETINAREIAPAAATKDMYTSDAASRDGGLAVAVPGELKGLHELHKKFGKLRWEEIVQPVVEVAENGYKVTKYLAAILVQYATRLRSTAGFNETFVDPKTGEFYKEGEIIKNQKLANTLKIIAAEGSDAIHGGGSLGQKLVDEIQTAGGIITMDDLRNFQPKWGKPTASELFNGEVLYTFPMPATGHVINFIFNVLNGYNFQDHSLDFHKQEKLIYHRIIEAFKFGFAARTKLGDEESAEVLKTLGELASRDHADDIRAMIRDDKTFNDFAYYGANASVVADHGTGHISILASNGDAVALTTTINLIMGSFVMSDSTGIIFNNEMNDFSIPAAESDGLLPAPANFIAPGKSPISSMSPVIVLDGQKDVSLVAGGAGGILIMTSIVQIIINHFYLNQTLEASLAAKRFHHQLQPMVVRHEEGYDPEVLQFLRSHEHELEEQRTAITGFAAINAVSRRNGVIEAAVDPRRGGKASIIDI